MQPFEVFSPPALGRLEPLGSALVAPELGHPARHLVEGVVGGGGAFGVADQLVLQAAALVATPATQPGETAPVGKLSLVCAAMASLFASHAWARSSSATATASGWWGSAGWPSSTRWCSAMRSRAGGRAATGRCAPPAKDQVSAPGRRRPARRRPAGRRGCRRGPRRSPGWCSRCGWAGGNVTGRYSPGRHPKRRCRAGGRCLRCRPGRRRLCGPRHATYSGCRRCVSPARTLPPASPPRPYQD